MLTSFSVPTLYSLHKLIEGASKVWQMPVMQAEVAVLGALSFANVLFYEDLTFALFFESAVWPLDSI